MRPRKTAAKVLLAAIALIASAVSVSSLRASEICSVAGETAPAVLEQLAAQKLPEVPAPQGYTAWENRFGRVHWTATRDGHPAHPAVVCRRVIQRETGMRIEMQAICDGPQAACDQLVADFQRLTDQLRRNVQPW